MDVYTAGLSQLYLGLSYNLWQICCIAIYFQEFAIHIARWYILWLHTDYPWILWLALKLWIQQKGCLNKVDGLKHRYAIYPLLILRYLILLALKTKFIAQPYCFNQVRLRTLLCAANICSSRKAPGDDWLRIRLFFLESVVVIATQISADGGLHACCLETTWPKIVLRIVQLASLV